MTRTSPSQLVRLAAALALHALSLALRWVPRSRRLVAFGSYRDTFADNSKYLYLELRRERPDLRVVWISGSAAIVRHVREHGGEAHRRWSLAGVLVALRARHWFVSAYASDVNVFFARGAVVTNLWHGIPLKKIERDIDSGPLHRLFHRPTLAERLAIHPGLFRRADWLLSPSETVSRALFAPAFGLPLERCVSAEPPRIAPLVCGAGPFAEMLRWSDAPTSASLSRVEGFRAFHLYMPTWRDSRPRFLGDLLPHMPALNELMARRGEAFVLKPHANTPRDLLAEFERFSNVVVVDPGADAYPLLRSAATLVTDYSSIYFDFLFVGRRIVFFPFDLDQYEAGDRGFYFPYEAHTPGPHARDVPELLRILQQPDTDEWREARRRTFHWAYGVTPPPRAVAVVNRLMQA